MSALRAIQEVSMNIAPFGMGVIGSSLTDHKVHGTSVQTMEDTAEATRDVSKATRTSLEEGRREDNTRLGALGDLSDIRAPNIHKAIY